MLAGPFELLNQALAKHVVQLCNAPIFDQMRQSAFGARLARPVIAVFQIQTPIKNHPWGAVQFTGRFHQLAAPAPLLAHLYRGKPMKPISVTLAD